ncbi:MAG: class I SAM-dependent methyltransferase [bacterium]
MSRIAKYRDWLRERGFAWTALYAIRTAGTKFVELVDRGIVPIEQRKFLTGKDTVSARYNSLAENRRRWDAHDWSRLGEEWTDGARIRKGLDPRKWKAALVERMLRRWVPAGAVVVEIGPGGGRWTEYLQPLASRLVLADISEKCLSLCRERFRDARNVEYRFIADGGLAFLDDASIDRIWSYDVFVHINPSDIEAYLRDFRRILKPGGVGVVHHAGGTYGSHAKRREFFRSYMDRGFFAHLVAKHGLELVEQDAELPHMPGDVISVFRRP